jgi:hypothetical protein
MKNYSMTYVAALVTITMSVSILLGVDLDEGTITELIQAVTLIVSGLATMYGRYRVGDLKFTGLRK